MKDHEQFVIDLPEVQPKITPYVTESGYYVRSRQSEQISEATGAAGVMIGAKALAADLKHRLGVHFA